MPMGTEKSMVKKRSVYFTLRRMTLVLHLSFNGGRPTSSLNLVIPSCTSPKGQSHEHHILPRIMMSRRTIMTMMATSI